MFGRRTYFLAAVQVGSLVGVLSLPAAAQEPANSYHYVANTRPPDAFLSLRNEPTTHQGQRIVAMPNGTLLQVIRRRNDGWLFVRVVESGQEGWALSAQGDRRWIECCKPATSPDQKQRVSEQPDSAVPARTKVAQAPSTTVLAQSGDVGYEPALRTLVGRLVAQLEAAGQKSGTVLDFTDLQGQGTELGRFLAQELSDQVIAVAKSLSLVDRANLQHLLRENKLSMEGLVNPETSRRLGNMIGIDTVILGTVTPIGNSVRLSVRGVAVETGRIVASQTATLAALGQLGELYTRGVTNPSESQGESKGPPAQKAHLRDRLRADSFRLIPNELVAVGVGSTISFTFENRSGIGVGVALRAGSTSAGPCRGENYAPRVTGLGLIDDGGIQRLSTEADPARHLRWLPHNAKVFVSVGVDDIYSCPRSVAGVASVPVTANFVVAAGPDVLVIPLTAEKMRVRVGQN